jgi:hypothetical protein
VLFTLLYRHATQSPRHLDERRANKWHSSRSFPRRRNATFVAAFRVRLALHSTDSQLRAAPEKPSEACALPARPRRCDFRQSSKTHPVRNCDSLKILLEIQESAACVTGETGTCLRANKATQLPRRPVLFCIPKQSPLLAGDTIASQVMHRRAAFEKPFGEWPEVTWTFIAEFKPSAAPDTISAA